MAQLLPGEIWRIDFGLAAKTRPALVLSDFPQDNELALVIVVPHTTRIRATRWEWSVPKPYLKMGVFHFQQIQPIPLARLDVKLGQLTASEFASARSCLAQLLHLG